MVLENMNEEMKEQFANRFFQDLLSQLEAQGVPTEKLEVLKAKGARQVMVELEESESIVVSTLPNK